MQDRSTSRRRLLRGAGLAGAASLAGCAGTIPGLETATPTPGDGGAVTGWAWDVAADALATTVDPYARQRDGRGVSIERVDHEAMQDEFRPALVSGEGAPAFAVLERSVAPTFIDTGGLADLSERMGPATRDRFVDGAWEAVVDDGGTYAVPWDVGPVATFYRRDVYETSGIDPETIETWDDFVAAGEQLPDSVDIINLPPNDLDGVWRRRLRQLGGAAFTEAGAVDLQSEASLRAARSIESLADAGIASNLESWGEEWFNAYAEGSIASLPAGAWMEQALRDTLADTAGEWGVYPLPAHESGGTHATNWGGSSLCLPAQTPAERADRAWDYVEWVTTSPGVQNDLYREFGVFPSLTGAYEADLYDEPLDFFGGQPIRRVFADLAGEMAGYRYSLDTPAVSRAMNEFLGRMIEGEFDAEEAVRLAAEQVADQTGRELA